jgi:hypothetical protein
MEWGWAVLVSGGLILLIVAGMKEKVVDQVTYNTRVRHFQNHSIRKPGGIDSMLMFVKASELLLLSLFATGCVVPRYNYFPMRTEISEPPLGKVHVAQVGDNMLRQGHYTEHEALYLFTDASLGWAYTAKQGYYLKKGENEDSEFFLPSNEPEGGQIIKAAIADNWQSLQAYKQEQRLCIVTVYNVYTCQTSVAFERRRRPVLQSDSFQQTLIYSGKVGNKINVGYREFSNNLARPAFNNTVEYDLTDSKVIGYRGARIEVIEATNEFIRYNVIQNFNKAQF